MTSEDEHRQSPKKDTKPTRIKIGYHNWSRSTPEVH